MAVFSDFFHGLFVLLTTASFCILVWEGIQRRSVFYTALFVVLGTTTFALHCEETGICNPLTHESYLRLQALDLGLSYFLLNVMLLVVLEIRMEVTGRLAGGALTLLIVARDVLDLPFNVLTSVALGAALLGVDAWLNHRSFRPAWWRRLALIFGMAAGGALLFKALKSLWAIHGIWHVYYVACCYLLLRAERDPSSPKQKDFNSQKRATATGSGAAVGLSTPMKRPNAGADAHSSIV